VKATVLWMKGRLLVYSGEEFFFFKKIIFPWVSVVLFKIIGKNN
jgi:hypothetical protein